MPYRDSKLTHILKESLGARAALQHCLGDLMLRAACWRGVSSRVCAHRRQLQDDADLHSVDAPRPGRGRVGSRGSPRCAKLRCGRLHAVDWRIRRHRTRRQSGPTLNLLTRSLPAYGSLRHTHARTRTHSVRCTARRDAVDSDVRAPRKVDQVPRARERAEVCEAARGVGARAAGRADAAAVGPPDPAGRHGRRLLLDEAAGREARRRAHAHAHARHTLSRAQVEGAKQEAENEKVKLAERIAQLSSETQEADRKKQQLLDALQRAQKELLKAQHTQLEYGHKVRETQELQTRCAAIETELMHAEVQKENEMALRARLETEVETLKE